MSTAASFDSSGVTAVLAPSIEMLAVSKSFGGVVANREVAYAVEPGEVHALLGENGAGKSTLMSILFGLVIPDSGTVRIDGTDVAFSSPADALAAGIGMVHQHFMLAPDLTVAENIAIGTRGKPQKRYGLEGIEQRVRQVAEEFDLDVDPRSFVRDLSVEDKQEVEIMKLLYRGARTIILDEPTASLGSAQIRSLLGIVRTLKASGRSVVIVTHKLDEVVEIADRATVMRAGSTTCTIPRTDFSEEVLLKAMFEEIPVAATRTPAPSSDAAVVLSVRNLAVTSTDGRQRLRNMTLDVRAGEIVGVAGVAGNGQTELFEALAGVAPVDRGEIVFGKRDVTAMSTLDRRRLGMGVIPEDRHRDGLVLDMSLAENLALSRVASGELLRRGVVKRRVLHADAGELLERFDVRPRDPDAIAVKLSGGNQQKAVVARELAASPKILVVSSPTRGVDFVAASAIQEEIRAAARRGCAVLLTSPDLEELASLSHRIMVVSAGAAVFECPADEVSIETLGRAMIQSESSEKVESPA